MDILTHSYNNIDTIFKKHPSVKTDIEETVTQMPLYLKASEQRGREGGPIFDPVGTNARLKDDFSKREWAANLRIPEEFSFLGTDIDFTKEGIITEAQFSNYPFLLNNLLRTELFLKSGVKIGPSSIVALVVITKAHKFPASNSTLYFEQAKYQLDALVKHKVFDVPILLVGLSAQSGKKVPAIWTDYSRPYSRTIVKQDHVTAILKDSIRENGRSTINIS